jgi:hypothetical protein
MASKDKRPPASAATNLIGTTHIVVVTRLELPCQLCHRGAQIANKLHSRRWCWYDGGIGVSSFGYVDQAKENEADSQRYNQSPNAAV